MILENNLFIKKVRLDREKINNWNEYPFSVEVIKNFEEITFNKNVTFLIGENGIGKSTFIEALAIRLGMNPEGGSQNFMFSTKETHSNLYQYLKIPMINRPITKYFLRAESFYNVISEIDNLGISGFYDNEDMHKCSHGESFIHLVKSRFYPKGLYILDEPEAALSPSRQMTLICMIDDLAKNGAQFIISSHSPILISYQDREILDLNNNFNKVKYEDTDIYKLYKMYLDMPYEMQRRLFQDSED